MEDMLLRPNAAPVYEFLARINAQSAEGRPRQPARILDCGAGGPFPPLVIFRERGFEAWGIDISEAELHKAQAFCQQTGMDLHLKQGDMRSIPFEDQSFDYVYEHFSMCHLSKRDTAVAVCEMRRVLKPGGLCFVGVISADSWPHSFFGDERAPGEFYGEEDGVPDVLHSMLSDGEMDSIVSGWEILVKEKHIRYLREAAAETSLEAWMQLHPEARNVCSADEWEAQHAGRADAFQYCHLYYYLKRPL